MRVNKSDLERQLLHCKAYDISTLYASYRDMDKTGNDRYMASGVIISIQNINKTKSTIIEPTMIMDGLSAETIEAIKKDIKRSYDLRMSFNTIK